MFIHKKQPRIFTGSQDFLNCYYAYFFVNPKIMILKSYNLGTYNIICIIPTGIDNNLRFYFQFWASYSN